MEMSGAWKVTKLSVGELDALSDKELVERARRSDARAFGTLVARYEERLLRLCAALTMDSELARDLAQVTWSRAFEGIAGLREGERFFGWLRRIATNQLRDQWKRRREPQVVPFNDFAHDQGDPDLDPLVTILTEERRERVGAALRELTSRERTLLALRYEQDLSYREIAELVGTSEGTVASWLYRAKERLRRLLDD